MTQFPADLPVLSERFQILNQNIQQRDQIIQESRRPLFKRHIPPEDSDQGQQDSSDQWLLYQ